MTESASQVTWDRLAPPDTMARYPDDMVTLVMSPAGGPVRLEASAVGSLAKPVGDLVNDVTGASPAYRMCTVV